MPDRKIKIVRRCPLCGKHHEAEFNKSELDAGLELRDRGYMIQDAFPTFTPEQREFLLTGMCPACWNNM